MKLIIRILVLILIGFSAVWLIPEQLVAQEPNKAAVVIRHAENNIQTACVSFEEPQITGLELLSRSGIDLVIDVQSGGALVCKINDTGCPANDCWCQCKGGGDCIYWSYWHMQENDWSYSQAGSSIFKIENGSVDGWSWGPGAVNEAIQPPGIIFEDVCQADPTNTPTFTPTTTNTPRPIIIPTQKPTIARDSQGPEPPAPPTATPTPTILSTVEPTATIPRSVTAAPLTSSLTPTARSTATAVITIAVQEAAEDLATPLPTVDNPDPTIIIDGKSNIIPSTTQLVTVEARQTLSTESPEKPVQIAEAIPKEVRSEKVEPEIQRTVIGAGIVVENGEQDWQSEAPMKADDPAIVNSDWTSYIVFLGIISSLSLLFIWVKRK